MNKELNIRLYLKKLSAPLDEHELYNQVTLY